MRDNHTVGFEIRTLSNLIKRQLDSTIFQGKTNNFSGVQGFIISYLVKNRDKELYQRDIESELRIRRSTATGILKIMEKNELIEREQVSCDGRLKKIVLTPKAMKFHEYVIKELKRVEEIICKGISEKELEAFFNTIEKMKNNLQQS